MPNSYDDPGIQYSQSGIPYDGTSGYQSPYPVAGVFIAFNDGPYVASPTWIEISTYVREISVHRGRSDDFEQFDTGTAQLVLDNRSRLFDPFYTSGTYYGKLTPRRQIRIVGQAGGVNYEVFRGYVAGWPVEWSQAGKDSTVTIQCFDALGLMANEVIPTDWPDYYTQAQNPTVYFKANDSQGTAIIRDQVVGSTKQMVNSNATANPNFFETPPIAPSSLSNSVFCASYVASDLDGGTTPADPLIGAYPTFSLSVWLKATGQALLGYNEIQINRNGGRMSLYYATNVIRMTLTRFGISSSPNQSVDLAYVPNQNQPVHVFIIATGTETPAIYVNGGLAPTTTTSIGTGSGGVWPLQVKALLANFQELAVWTRTNFTAAEIATIYNAGAGRFAETTTARMNRLIGTTSYPAALTSFTSTPVATVAEIGSGTGIIPEMQLVADSEGGEIYVSKAGALTTTNRTDVFTATRSAVSQATFTDSGAGLSYGPELLIEYDGDAQRNDVTVTFSGDGEVNQYNTYATSLYGGQATTIETQLADPTSASNLALVELGVEGSLIPRISPIDVSTNTAAASWQTILSLELLDRVTFKRTPTVGNQFNRDALINAIDHQIRPGVWNTQLTLSMRYTSPETLDDDVLGLLDLNYLG